MKMACLTPIEIRILLKCSESPLAKKEISQLYRTYTHEDRTLAINNLIENNFILSKYMPKPGSKKIPIYYWITDIGKKWVSEYIKNFPSKELVKL